MLEVVTNTERLQCAHCGKKMTKNKALLVGWWRGVDGQPYCSDECKGFVKKPKGRGHGIAVRLAAPSGATIADVVRWRQQLTKAFAELAVGG